MIALEVRNLCKSFGGLKAIDNISIIVQKGEKRAIIGPNGAGKTTLLNLIGGFLTCDKGQILIFGKDVTHLPDYKRIEFGLGRTFQLINIFSELSILENLLLAIQAIKPYKYNILKKQKGYKDLLDKAELLLNQWDLWNKKNKIVSELSYGDQRKLEILMGLASEPEILLLDEPTCGLNMSESANFSELIAGAIKNKTLLIVEHDMDVVFSLADKITVLHYGGILAEGTPKEISDNEKVRQVYLGEKK